MFLALLVVLEEVEEGEGFDELLLGLLLDPPPPPPARSFRCLLSSSRSPGFREVAPQNRPSQRVNGEMSSLNSNPQRVGEWCGGIYSDNRREAQERREGERERAREERTYMKRERKRDREKGVCPRPLLPDVLIIVKPYFLFG